MRTRLTLTVLAATLAVASCSSDGDDDAVADEGAATTDAESTDDGTDPAQDDTDEATAEPDDSTADEPTDAESDIEVEPAPPEPGEGVGTLTLDNGEIYEVDMLCTLEPQIAAGSEILFTATSTGDPLLDITQFGDEGPVTGIGSVTLIDGSTIEPLWGASTFYESFGGSLELTLDGNTIRGTGDFYPADDPIEGGDPVTGEVVAEC